MRRIGADRLQVHAAQPSAGRNHRLYRRVALEAVRPRQRVVVPGDPHRRLTLRHRAVVGDHRHQVPRLVHLGKVVQTRLRIVQRTTVRQRRRIHRQDRLVRGARVARHPHRRRKLWLQQVGPVLWRFGNDVLVDHERQHAVVVAVPVPVRILHLVRDRVPGRDLVRRNQPFRLRLGPKREAHVDHVRRLRPFVALVRPDRFHLIPRTGVRVQFVHRQAVLGLETVDHLAIVAPVVRQGNRRQLPFCLRRFDQLGHRVVGGRLGRGGGRFGCGGGLRRGGGGATSTRDQHGQDDQQGAEVEQAALGSESHGSTSL